MVAAAISCLVLMPSLLGCSDVGALKTRLASIGNPFAPSTHASHAPVPASISTEITGATSATPTLAYFSETPSSQAVNNLIGYYAMIYGVPETMVRKVIQESSNYNEFAHFGDRYGLMQVHIDAARAMGYEGAAEGLFDPDTNLNYGVRYLAGAYLLAKGDEPRTEKLYYNGYYTPPQNSGLVEVASQK